MNKEKVLNKVSIKCIMILAVLGIALSGCIGIAQDSDGDGWTDDQEIKAGTNPNLKDTDGDNIWDPKDENPLDVNIPIIQNTPTPTPTPSPTPRSSINIKTSAIWTTRAPNDPSFPYGQYGGMVDVGASTGDRPGTVSKSGEPAYFIVTFEILNDGYEEISTYLGNFKIVYNKAKYSPIKGSYYLEDVLPNADLLNGGVVKGSIAYVVTYDGHKNYEVIYNDGINEYNVDHSLKS